MINFFKNLFNKDQTIKASIDSEIIITPDNVCPSCSSDSGFKTNNGLKLVFWRCKNCYAQWMTINEKPND